MSENQTQQVIKDQQNYENLSSESTSGQRCARTCTETWSASLGSLNPTWTGRGGSAGIVWNRIRFRNHYSAEIRGQDWIRPGPGSAQTSGTETYMYPLSSGSLSTSVPAETSRTEVKTHVLPEPRSSLKTGPSPCPCQSACPSPQSTQESSIYSNTWKKCGPTGPELVQVYRVRSSLSFGDKILWRWTFGAIIDTSCSFKLFHRLFEVFIIYCFTWNHWCWGSAAGGPALCSTNVLMLMIWTGTRSGLLPGTGFS